MRHNFWRLLLIAVLGVALTAPAEAESIDTAGKQIVAGIVVVSAAITVGITLLVRHAKHRSSSITGCIASGAGGLTVTEERERQTYELTGDPVGVIPGDRMTLEGRRQARGRIPVFEAKSVTRDLGLCKP